MSTNKCIVDYCSNDTTTLGSARGLCRSHYGSVRKLITKGITTWEQLEEKGKALPDGRTTSTNELIDWINS